MTLSPMEPNVSDNSCLGLERIQVCRLHEERPSIARKAPFQAKNQASEQSDFNGEDQLTKQIDGHWVFGAIKLPGI
jgi:hypothetical protein